MGQLCQPEQVGLHEHADVVDAIRLRDLRRAGYSTMTMAEMLEELGVTPSDVEAS